MEEVAALRHLDNVLFFNADSDQVEFVDADTTTLVVSHLLNLGLFRHLREFECFQLTTDVCFDAVLSQLPRLICKLNLTTAVLIRLLFILLLL